MIRLIGDVHGKYPEYLDTIQDCSHSVQLGDFGFDYSVLDTVDPEKHKICAGNHEVYPQIVGLPHYLGDFGHHTLNGVSFFAVRGSYSIDKARRVVGKTWFPEEELTQSQGMACLDLYEKVKPSLVVSHDAPIVLKPLIQRKEVLAIFGISPDFSCATQHLLQQMWEIHQPKLWVYGHWHKNSSHTLDGTLFIGLNELNYIDVDTELKIG